MGMIFDVVHGSAACASAARRGLGRTPVVGLLGCALVLGAAGALRAQEARDAPASDKSQDTDADVAGGGDSASKQAPARASGTIPASVAAARPDSQAAPAHADAEAEADFEAAGSQEAADELGEADAAVAEPGTGLFEQGLSGELEDEETDAEGEDESLFELDGYVRSDVFVGQNPDSKKAAAQAGYGELALQIRGPRESFGSAYAEARLRYGQQLDSRELIIDLREAYVDLFAGPLDVRLGQQIIVWGRADAFNPTNNLMPLDFRVRSPIEDDRRIGNVGARAFYDLSPVRLEGVWLPFYLATEYPSVEPGEYIAVVDPVFPGTEIDNGLGALRVHLELPAFEASVSYLYGHAPLPGLSLRGYSVGPDPPLGQDPPEVRVARTAYRHHVVGFDFSTAVSDLFALRVEAAYRHPLAYESRIYAARPDLQYVIGGDRTFGSVNLIAQYMGRYVFDWEREMGSDSPVTPIVLLDLDPPLPALTSESIEARLGDDLAQRNQALFSQTEELQHAITLRVEWLTLHETLALSALGMINFSTEEWLLFPKLEYRFTDALRGYAGAEIYFGPEGTLFDLIDHKLTAGFAELRYSF